MTPRVIIIPSVIDINYPASSSGVEILLNAFHSLPLI